MCITLASHTGLYLVQLLGNNPKWLVLFAMCMTDSSKQTWQTCAHYLQKEFFVGLLMSWELQSYYHVTTMLLHSYHSSTPCISNKVTYLPIRFGLRCNESFTVTICPYPVILCEVLEDMHTFCNAIIQSYHPAEAKYTWTWLIHFHFWLFYTWLFAFPIQFAF